MDDKKRVYDFEVMTMPSLHLVLVDVPDSARRNGSDQRTLKPIFDKKRTVKRLIAHLEED